MYSIAAHKEEAIGPLLKFINTSANNRGKYGAVYCLHLIGINSHIAGRFYEEFTNKKARQALLSLLSYSKLNSTITRLLMRDPWQSDIQALVEALRYSSDNTWSIINALKQQGLPGLPIGQEIPASTSKITFEYPRVIFRIRKEEDAAAARNEMNRNDTQIMGILQAIRALVNPMVKIEDSLMVSHLFWGNWSTEFGCKNCIGVGGKVLLMSAFLEHMQESRIQYFFENKILNLCASETARHRIIVWWDAQPVEFRARFTEDKASTNRESNLRVGY